MFIVFEGTEGVGKSTLVNKLKNHIEQCGIPVKSTREPGGTVLAERIRQILIEPTDEAVDPETELLLFFASRKQNIIHNIIPALEHKGAVLISDRFVFSSAAYQVYGRGVSLEKFNVLVDHFVGVKPDIVFWLDAPVEVGMDRAKNTRQSLDRFEMEKLSFFQKIRHGFGELQRQNPDLIIRIDATQPIDQIFNNVLCILRQKGMVGI